MAALSMSSIISYANTTPGSRNLDEAERLIRSNFVITFGATKITDKEMDILALCLQTSAMKERPHTITGTLKKKEMDFEIGEFDCSCKAGAGICKHKTAVQLLCYRTNLSEIKELSSTDIQCLWDKQKLSIQEMFMPVPVSDFCCVSYKAINTERINTDNTLSMLLAACPNSALVKHLMPHKRKISEQDTPKESSKRLCNTILPQTILIEEIFKQKLPYTLSIPEMSSDQKMFYEENICVDFEKAIKISKIKQNTEEWKESRKLRITASRCLYTYAKNKKADWGKKLSTFFSDSFKGHFSTKYGLEKEVEVKELLKNKFTILNTGLLVHPSVPWLGYSPDGILIDNNKLTILEIKCPVQGLTTTAVELIKTLDYICIENGQYIIKEKHKYYGQVQCGMHLTNADQCYFLIYASKDKTYVLIVVK